MLPLVRDRKPIGRSTKDIFLHSAHQSLQQQKVEKVCRQQKNVIQGCWEDAVPICQTQPWPGLRPGDL